MTPGRVERADQTVASELRTVGGLDHPRQAMLRPRQLFVAGFLVISITLLVHSVPSVRPVVSVPEVALKRLFSVFGVSLSFRRGILEGLP